MNVHKNARLTPRGREVLVSRLERGEHPRDVGTARGVGASTSTVYKWRRRYCAEGLADDQTEVLRAKPRIWFSRSRLILTNCGSQP